MSRMLFFVVCLPRLVDDVSMDRVRIFFCHSKIRERKFWRIGEAWHALVPVRAAEHDAIPVAMDFRRRIA